MRSATRKKTGKDKAYLAWLHTQPCIVPCCEEIRLKAQAPATNMWRIEAAHVGERGMSQKCPDREALPMCAFHHRIGLSSHHKIGKLFWPFHGLDKEELIAEHQQRYENLVQ